MPTLAELVVLAMARHLSPRASQHDKRDDGSTHLVFREVPLQCNCCGSHCCVRCFLTENILSVVSVPRRPISRHALTIQTGQPQRSWSKELRVQVLHASNAQRTPSQCATRQTPERV